MTPVCLFWLSASPRSATGVAYGLRTDYLAPSVILPHTANASTVQYSNLPVVNACGAALEDADITPSHHSLGLSPEIVFRVRRRQLAPRVRVQ